ncbi:MAG: hypothetical protein ACXWBH_02500 [Candidatus Angelobacter sp.]
MRAHGSCDQPQPSDQQDKHDESVEEGGGLKVNMHVGDHASQDEQRARGGEHPSDLAAPVEEQDSDAEQQRNKRNAEAVGSPRNSSKSPSQ